MSHATSVASLENGVHRIETGFVRPGLAAAYLVVENGRAAFVETGTARSVPALLSALDELGLGRDAVDYVFVTHVHLDHAGGAGALMAALPQARLVVHPRGARHMIDPAKLEAGSIEVYGEETFARNYDRLTPVPADRVVEAPDGLAIELAGRPLHLLDTPGHAYHHVCIHDPRSGGVFTGDTFGLSYREFDTPRGAFVFPTTTPIHFDPEAMHASIDRIVALAPDVLYLTHYGAVTGVGRLAADLHAQIDELVGIARRQEAGPRETRHARIVQEVGRALTSRVRAHGVTLPEPRLKALLDMDVELDAQGLEVWLDKNPA